jgi:DNA-binding transcriptional LysR family regulator
MTFRFPRLVFIDGSIRRDVGVRRRRAGGQLFVGSRRLGAPIASVSRRVSELEDELGVQLLARSTRKLRLTESGQRFFEASKDILERVAEAERVAAGEYHTPRGKIVMTAPIVLGRQHVVPIVAEFLAVFQDVEIEVRLTTRFFKLAESGIDLSVWVRDWDLPDLSQPATFLGGLAQVICASPQYLAERGRPAHPRDLIAHDCVTYVDLDSRNEWFFTIDGVREAAPVRGRLRTISAEAAVEAALVGAGLIRSGKHAVAQPILDGQLIPVLSGFEPEPFPVYLVLPSERAPPLKVKTFLDFLKPRLEARLRWLEEVAAPGDR